MNVRSYMNACYFFDPRLGCVASVRIVTPLALSLCAVLMLSWCCLHWDLPIGCVKVRLRVRESKRDRESKRVRE